MEYRTDVLFREEQGFGPWVRGLLFLSLVGTVAALVFAGRMLYSGPGGKQIITVFLAVAAVVALTELATFWVIAMGRMVTELHSDGIFVQAYPITKLRRRIGYEEVKSCQARKYNPLGEYGGWGIRSGPNGKAYNTRGDQGVQIEMHSGEKLLIGSQRAQELAAAIQTRIR